MLSGGGTQPRADGENLQHPGNVIFLDEPTNDLDVETLQALEQAILRFAGCAIIIRMTAGSSTASRRISSRSKENSKVVVRRQLDGI